MPAWDCLQSVQMQRLLVYSIILLVITCVRHTVQCPRRPQEGVRFAEVRITSGEPPNTLGAEPGTELRSSVKATGVPSRSAMDGFSEYL